MLRLLILCVTAFALVAQVPSPPANQYGFTDSFSSTSSETLTLQLPANSNRGWYGYWLKVSLNSPSTTATVCFGNNWSTASATAGTLIQLFGAQIPVTKIYTASNATGSTYYCEFITGSQAWNMSNTFMKKSLTTVQNFNVLITGTSLTGYAAILGSEQ